MPGKDQLELRIDMDAACTSCGDKGTTPSGLCLACVTKRIGRRPRMTAEEAIFDADVKRIAHVLKIEREEGYEVVRKVVTQIVLETEADVSDLATMQHVRDLRFVVSSYQRSLDLAKRSESEAPAEAGADA